MPVRSGLVPKAEINNVTVTYEGAVVLLILAVETKPGQIGTVLKWVV